MLTPEQAQDLVNHFGSQGAVARAVGIPQSTLSYWLAPARARATMRQYKVNNPEKVRAKHRQYRTNNLEKVRDRHREWQRQWRANHSEQARAESRERYWRMTNAEFREYTHKRSLANRRRRIAQRRTNNPEIFGSEEAQ